MTTITEKWLKKVNKAEKKLKEKHRTDAEKSEKHYYNEKDDIEIPIWWSSINSKAPTLYAKPPEPEIRTRNKDAAQPGSKEISKLLEEVIRYEIDQSDFDSDAKKAVLDFLITDLGVARVVYDAETDKIKNEYLDTGYEDVVTKQSITIDHWPWKRFVWDIGKDWAECDWICYIHFMTKAEIKEQFDYDVSTSKANVSRDDEKDSTYKIYEIWDKKKKAVYEFYAGKDKPLRARKDPFKLKGFWDCPKPLIVNMRSDKYIPQSDFKQVRRQLEIINQLECRIDSLTQNVKYRGFHDEGIPELSKVAILADGKFAPIKGLNQLNNGNGVPDFSKALAIMPIMEPAQVIQILEGQKKEAKDQLFELTGLSDIMRGSTKASETATAQQIKSNYGQVRLMTAQSAVNGWLRSIMRIYAELIAEHFTPMQLQKMTGVDVTQPTAQATPENPHPPTMHEIMKSDVLRCYAIDVETDSSIQADESQDKQDRMEMVNTLLPLLQGIIPMIHQGILTMDMGKSLLLTAVRGYKFTRGLEDMIEGMGDSMQQMQQMQQQLQDQQMQMQQMDQGYQQQLAQANQMVGDLQQQLGQVNERKEQRDDMDKQAEVAKDYADVDLKKAQADKIRFDISQPVKVGMDQYQL